MKKLFTNLIVIEGKRDKVVEILLNIAELSTWNPAIVATKKLTVDSFEIYRHDGINLHEIITVRETADGVTYDSTGGKLEYRLEFSLLNEAGYTKVTENFYVSGKTKLELPLTLLSPIAKHAFNQNLDFLKKFSELVI